MRRWALSDLALDRPVTIGMALCAVLLLGVIGLFSMPLSFLPSNTKPRLYVRVQIERTSPEVLEREVIRPIEDQVATVRDLERIQVGSGSWGVKVNLDFAPGTDIDARKLELRDRIERVRGDMPDFVNNVFIGSYSNFDDPVLELQVSSEADLSQQYYLIEKSVVRRLERVPGVARVELDGVSPHELEVRVDLDAIESSGVALEDLNAAVRDARGGRSLGLLRDGQHAAGLRAPNTAAEPARFSSIPLPRAAGPQALDPAGDVVDTSLGTDRFAALGEVADVTAQAKNERRVRRLNGRRAINLEIYAQAGASAVEVSEKVQALMLDLRSDPALSDIEILTIEDQGSVILQTLGDLRDTGIYGGLLGLVILFGFLHRGTTTLAASVSIPMSVVAAGGVLFLRGDELNCIVLLGLVLGVGMLVDNAVVIVEAIALQAQRGKDSLQAARDGAREVGFATIASTLSTIIVFIPLVATESHDELLIYLKPLGITFAIGLVCSLLVSQTAIPLLMGRVLRPRPKQLRHRILTPLSAGYARFIRITIRFPRLTLLLGIALAGSAAVPLSEMELELGEAEFKPRNVPLRLQFAGSRGFERIEKHIEAVEQALLEDKQRTGVEAISCSFSDNWGSCRVYPSKTFQSEAEEDAFNANLTVALPSQVGVTYRVGERDFDWRETRDKHVVEFALKGEDMGALIALSEDVADHLERRLQPGDRSAPEAGGYDSIITPFDEGARELHVSLRDDRLRRVGLTPDQVANRVAMAFQGLPLGTTRGPQGDLELRLSADIPEETGAGIAMLRDLKLETDTGDEITLSSMADIEIARRPYWIQRVDRQTEARVKVRFFTPDRKANFKLISAALADFQFPPGYSWGRGTKWKQKEEVGNEMLINLGLCLLLVYAVMASLFESYLQPLGILITCLLGCFGAPWALWLTGTTLDTTAVVGFFILIGVVVNNGIMLVDRVTHLRGQGHAREDALRMAGEDRLRPILMTMTTTVLGLLPMLVHHPTLAGVYYHAIAIVIAGGLLTSTVMTLVFLPASYTLLEGISRSAQRAWSHAFGKPS
ncbi:MAG: efflux RND transporter permease subunit [Myxococcota bacterium]